MSILLIFVVLSFQGVVLVVANYEFEYRAMDVGKPNDDKWLNFDKVKIKRMSRNEPHKMYGEMNFIGGITEDIDFLAELYIKQGGEYRKTVYKLKMNLCEIIETETVFYPSIGAAIEPKWPEKVKKR